MIVSASYKTDIPAFYGEWFMNRVRAASCKMVNPYGRQVYTVPLDADSVDGFVFWTKNLGPFLHALHEVRDLGFPFMVQYTINGYPRALEYSATDAERSCEHMRRLARTFGPGVAVWRYDPVIVTSATPRDWHAQNFERLARKLSGSTDEVVISFAHFYAKTRRNLAVAARAFHFTFEDPEDSWKRETAARLAEIAGRYGMRLSLCSQPEYLSGSAGEARCVDAARLSRVAGKRISAELKGNRPGCGCHAARDIGEYDTCPMGCVYCYAVQHRTLARRRFKAHDPENPFLFAPPVAPPVAPQQAATRAGAGAAPSPEA